MNPKYCVTLAIFAIFGVNGCSKKESSPTSKQFAVEVLVSNDDGDPLQGAIVGTGKTKLGTTSADGKLSLELTGTEGQVLLVTLACPDGFDGPTDSLPLRLTHNRRINLDGYQPTRFEATCTRNVRDIVLMVRAQNGAGIPLLVDGKPSGVTDTDGIAHVLVRAVRTMKSLDVSLDTSARQELKPKSPSRTYELTGNDAVLVFDQSFVVSRKPIYRDGSPKARKHIPYRVD